MSSKVGLGKRWFGQVGAAKNTDYWCFAIKL